MRTAKLEQNKRSAQPIAWTKRTSQTQMLLGSAAVEHRLPRGPSQKEERLGVQIGEERAQNGDL